jgi:hypothetical protein
MAATSSRVKNLASCRGIGWGQNVTLAHIIVQRWRILIVQFEQRFFREIGAKRNVGAYYRSIIK